jgi:hypothetical protein
MMAGVKIQIKIRTSYSDISAYAKIAISNKSAQDLIIIPDQCTLGEKITYHLDPIFIATTTEARRQEAPHLRGSGATILKGFCALVLVKVLLLTWQLKSRNHKYDWTI